MASELILERNVSTDDFAQRAGKRLYVEGQEDSIDKEVIDLLTKGLGLTVRTLGTSSNIRTAVNALHADHPHYAYLIDRDYLDEPSVEDAWRDFPDPAKGNLLIWRKRSVENYFLDVKWLSKSKFFVRGKEVYLQEKLERAARTRAFLDAANLTVGIFREARFRHSILFDHDVARYATRAKGRMALLTRPERREAPSAIAAEFASEKVAGTYESIIADMLGDRAVQKFGHGTWCERMDAKPLSNAVFELAAFDVRSTSGSRKLTAREKRSTIIRNLIERDEGLPRDFLELRAMLKAYLARPA
jgi:hypothetical protein